MKKGIESLLVDTSVFGIGGASDPFGLMKTAQEQPDNVQFAQDFSNMAFQFLQDRSPALMKYILGFEVVDRADNGTRAVGIFGFKIDGDYYYVPAFFVNSQIKGVNSILSKKTNSFVPLTEEWVNYIINRKAHELGSEAPGDTTSDPSQFENPTFDFLQRPTVGPLGGPAYSSSSVQKVAEDKGENRPWAFKEAWKIIKGDLEKRAAEDPEFKKSFAGFFLAFTDTRSPLAKEASSPIQGYIEKIGGPKAEITFMNALRDTGMANAALEFYQGPGAFHVSSYPEGGMGNYMLRKKAEEISRNAPKVVVTTEAGSEDEAREILEDGFSIRDTRPEESKSDVIETEYEARFQNPDVPGVYNVLVNGGKTEKAYVLNLDPIYHSPEMAVYFPSNKQVIYARSRDILCEGGAVGSLKDIYDAASSVENCSIDKKYMFVGDRGTALPEFHTHQVRKEDGRRPVIDGGFSYYEAHHDYEDLKEDDFFNHWVGDRYHHVDGSRKNDTSVFGSIELADFKGSPKSIGGSVVLPSNWKALPVYDSFDRSGDSFVDPISSEDSEDKSVRLPTYRLGSLDSLSRELRKEGAAKLEVRSDDGLDYYLSFDGGRFTRPVGYKQACVDMVTRLGMDSRDAKRLLKKAAVERKAKCLLKLGQFVGVDAQMPPEQTPEVDPYTGIPVYQSPYYDASTMPFYGNDPTVSEDNQIGENIGGDIQAQSQMGGDPSGEAEFDPEAAQLAQDAARLGQKDVFDKAAIGGLAKVYDTGAVIDSYLPEFMQALDRIGRVLFLYYWKHDDFTARYGTDGVVEMEDVLKNVFNNLGKLTMELKSKAVGGGDSQDGGADII